MNNICIKIVEMVNGNVIEQIQWFNISTFFFPFMLKKIQQIIVRLIFLKVLLFELKSIFRLLMHLVIYE
jgi:hypothetical protein